MHAKSAERAASEAVTAKTKAGAIKPNGSKPSGEGRKRRAFQKEMEKDDCKSWFRKTACASIDNQYSFP